MIIDSLRPIAVSGLTLCIVMACAGVEPTNGQENFQALRERMVEAQIRARDVQSPAVLRAMARVPRHLFIPDDQRSHSAAYLCPGRKLTL